MDFNIPLLLVCIVCALILIIAGRKRPDIVITFFLRIGLCFVAIYFINDVFLQKGIEVCAAYNMVTLLVCGILGFPGLFLIYCLAFRAMFPV